MLEVIKGKLEIQDLLKLIGVTVWANTKEIVPGQSLLNLTNSKTSKKILRNARNLNDTGIFIYEDFREDTMELRKSLWEQVLEHCRQNKIAYLNCRSIILRDSS